MKAGFVTDVHYGSGVDGDTVSLLERIAETFEQAGVELVVLLGDIATGESREAARERAETVRDVFGSFDLYATPGNADVREIVEDVFDETGNSVIAETEEAVTTLVDSAPTSEHGAGGWIDEAGIDLVERRLSEGDPVRVVTHYPLQRTEHLPPIFTAYPEQAYPINKQQFDAVVMESEGTLVEVICGHLHPNAKLQVRGDPLDVPLTVLEPVVRIEDPYGGTGRRTLNERIAVEDLVFEL